jgi:hypothetical protein
VFPRRSREEETRTQSVSSFSTKKETMREAKKKNPFTRIIELILNEGNPLEQVTAMSLVKSPAIQIPWVAFSKAVKPFKPPLDPNNLTPYQEGELLRAIRSSKRAKERMNPLKPKTKNPLTIGDPESIEEQRGYQEPKFMTVQDRVKANNANIKAN